MGHQCVLILFQTLALYKSFTYLLTYLLMVVALCFMEIWNRRQGELQYDWDVADFEIEEVTLDLYCIYIFIHRKP